MHNYQTDNTNAIFSDKTYVLEDQILHKLALLDKLVPTSATLTLIGHSIGCKVIMEVFKRNTNHKIKGIVVPQTQPNMTLR